MAFLTVFGPKLNAPKVLRNSDSKLTSKHNFHTKNIPSHEDRTQPFTYIPIPLCSPLKIQDGVYASNFPRNMRVSTQRYVWHPHSDRGTMIYSVPESIKRNSFTMTPEQFNLPPTSIRDSPWLGRS